MKKCMSFFTTLERFFPYLASGLSILGCVTFLQFYLTETSDQFASDFFTQNLNAISNGDSYQVAKQLNSLSASVQWVCILAEREGKLFYRRVDLGNCESGFWRQSISVPRSASSPIKIAFTLTLPRPLKWAFYGFMTLQLTLLWSLFLSGRKAAARDERRKSESEHMLFRFAEQVAHDIRGPVTALNFIAATFEADDQKAKLIKSVALRINNLAAHMLPTSRSVEGLTKALNSTVTSTGIVTLLQQLLNEKRCGLANAITLTLEDFIELEVTVRGSASDVQRMFSNIIDNAVEATDEGLILISLRAHESTITVSVSDTGKGIAAHILPKLFIEGATFGKSRGNGLGLSWAKREMERLNGTIHVSSELGRGTTITCSFSLAKNRNYST